MPWLVMQLPCWDGTTSAPWPWVRQGQWETSRVVPNVGLATTCDVSDSSNLHPAQKRAAGERLARLALAKVYAKPIIAQGPTPNRLRLAGGKMVVDFDTGGTTISLHGGDWNDVEIAAADGIYHPAQATFAGNTATLTSAAVREPRAIRYGCAPVFTPTLFNADGLPTAPFALWIDEAGSSKSGILNASSPAETTAHPNHETHTHFPHRPTAHAAGRAASRRRPEARGQAQHSRHPHGRHRLGRLPVL